MKDTGGQAGALAWFFDEMVARLDYLVEKMERQRWVIPRPAGARGRCSGI